MGRRPRRSSTANALTINGRPLSPFPINLLTRILRLVPIRTAVALLRVNSAFYNAGVPVVYERITLAEHGLWPTFSETEYTTELDTNRTRARFASYTSRPRLPSLSETDTYTDFGPNPSTFTSCTLRKRMASFASIESYASTATAVSMSSHSSKGKGICDEQDSEDPRSPYARKRYSVTTDSVLSMDALDLGDEQSPANKRTSDHITPTPPPRARMRKLLQRGWLSQLVRYVDVYAHRTEFCAQEEDVPQLPTLPHLDTLRVHMTQPLGTSSSCRSFHTSGEEERLTSVAISEYPWTKRVPTQMLPQCNVLANLKPRQLVAVGAPALCKDTLITALPYTPLDAVQSYVCVLSPDAPLLLSDESSDVPILRARAIAADISNVPNAGDVAIVFWTPTPWDQWRGSVPPERTAFAPKLNDTWAGRFFTELASLIAQTHYSQRVTLVNTGALDKYATGLAAWDSRETQHAVEDHFRHALRYELAKTLREAKAKGEGDILHWAKDTMVRFQSMHEYLATTDWSGVFDPQSLERWLCADANAGTGTLRPRRG